MPQSEEQELRGYLSNKNPKVRAAAEKRLAALKSHTAGEGGGETDYGPFAEEPETTENKAARQMAAGEQAQRAEMRKTDPAAARERYGGGEEVGPVMGPGGNPVMHWDPLAGNKQIQESMAAAGDKEAKDALASRERFGEAAGTAAGGAAAQLVPGGGAGLASLIRMGLQGLVGGGVGAGTSGIMQEKPPAEVGKDVARGGTVGAGLSLLLGLPFALAKNRVAALRSDPVLGEDLLAAEKGGYKTNFSQGMTGPKPLGPQAIDRELSRAAEKEILPAVQNVDKAVDETAQAATSPLFAQNPAPKVDLRPFESRLQALGIKRATATPEELEATIKELQDAGDMAKQYGKSVEAAAASKLQGELQALRSAPMRAAKAAHSTEISKVKNIKDTLGVSNKSIDELPEEDIGLAKTRLASEPEAVRDTSTIGRMKGKLKQVGANTQVTEELDNLAAMPGAPPGTDKAVAELKSFMAAERTRARSGSGGSMPSQLDERGLLRKLFEGNRINRDPAWRFLAEQSGIIRGAASAGAGAELSTNRGKQVAESLRRVAP